VPTHVGQYGGSSPEKVWQWLAIDAGVPNAAAVSYDATTGVCSNVPAAASVEFLTATTGQALNPQARIVAVRVRWSTESWVVAREDGGAQLFSLRTTVSWTELDPVRADYTPPTPPVIPPLPSDLFYPFASSSIGRDSSNIVAASGAAGIGAGRELLVAAVAVAVLAAALLR
jgi:tectonic-1/3